MLVLLLLLDYEMNTIAITSTIAITMSSTPTIVTIFAVDSLVIV